MVNPAENFREIKMLPEKNDKNLKTIYEQYWLHARHVADERLWFTNIYILVVVGILIFLQIDQPLFIRLGVTVFVLLLSVAGFLICHSLTVHFITYSRTAELIQINEWDAERGNPAFGSGFFVRSTLSQFSFDGVELVFGNLYPQFLGDLYMFPGQLVLLQLIKPESKSVMRIADFRVNLDRF